METANDGIKTARRYKCLSCYSYAYTCEVRCDKLSVTPLFSKKRKKYYE